MPPSPTDKTMWHAILKTLACVHQISSDHLPDEIPLSVNAVQHPEDMLTIIRNRFATITDAESGHVNRSQLAMLIDLLEAYIPNQWSQSAPQSLIHGDCHTANMIMRDNKIVLVDWENSGVSDPALDISNMTSLWRFLHLPDSHHQWLITTYAKMIKDDWLVDRVRIYRLIQFVHWAVNYTLFVQRRLQEPVNSTIKHRFSLEFQLKWQQIYYEKACTQLGIG